MSFTWKFTKPVSKMTLTGNSSPSYTTNTAAGTKFAWPAGAGDDPTYDILKAQIDELRANLDSADDVGKIRCSSHYGTVLTSKYDTHCPGQYTTHKYCTTYYSGHYNPTVCSYTYSARYTSKYGTRYNNQGSCPAQNYGQYDYDRSGKDTSNEDIDDYHNCTSNDSGNQTAADDWEYTGNNTKQWNTNRVRVYGTNLSGYDSSERDTHNNAQRGSVNSEVNNSHCSGNG